MDEKIRFYILNDFLKFERTIYLGRHIQFKSLLYFVGAAAVLFGGAVLPIIGGLFAAIPFTFRIFAAAGFAYLLSDVGTENRSPLSFFQSFLTYHFLTPANVSYYKGKEIPNPRPVKFERLPNVEETAPEPEPLPAAEQRKPPLIKLSSLTKRSGSHEIINGLPDQAN